jgi:hypothetical protein
VLGNKLVFGAHPIGLGVDDGAIHVPQNGGESRGSHDARV